MKRVVVPELLDTDSGSPHDIEGSLADLRMINRWFGGVHTMAGLIRKVAARQKINSLSWLDAAGSSGDVAALTGESLSRSGLQVHPVLLDSAVTHLNGKYPSVCSDAMKMPFRDNSFDVVGSTLFVHHLEPLQIIAFINEALRVCRYAVLINDLVRSRMHLAMSYAGYLLYRSPLTRHDAVASVRRAYTVEEMNALLKQTSAASVDIQRFFMFRMGVIAWKRPITI
ncbi:MAG: hypothetical protein DMG65_16040 [Candidatus Angelobacter sp. Gp1-AA117]|nr:MAG: hypothetical protein DMG65_16040 [Candidatus Angelobacter sp. Gp1-AA117]